MKFERQWIPNYTELEDEELLKQIELLRKELEDTKNWLEESANEKGPMAYINKRMAKLAHSLAREKYRLYTEEAQKRGILD